MRLNSGVILLSATFSVLSLFGCQGFGNLPDAVVVSSSDSGSSGSDVAAGITFDTLTEQCSGFVEFVSGAESALKSNCQGCHGPTSGSGQFALQTGGTESDSVTNYVEAMGFLLENDGEGIEENPILKRPLGSSHTTVFPKLNVPAAVTVSEWIDSEYTDSGGRTCPLVERGGSD